MPSGNTYDSGNKSTPSYSSYDSDENPAATALFNLVGMAVAVIAFFVSAGYVVTLNLLIVIPCGVTLWFSVAKIEHRALARMRDERRWNGKKDKKVSLFGIFLYGVMVVLSAIAYYRIAVSLGALILLVPLVAGAVGLFKRVSDFAQTKRALKGTRSKLGSRGRRVHGFSIFLYGAMFVLSAIAFFTIRMVA